ncbi:sigma-70 family RNA polymerase sigma factor [Streptomyces sp. NPDC001514]
MTTALLTRTTTDSRETARHHVARRRPADPRTPRRPAHAAPRQTATAADLEDIVEQHGAALGRFCLSLTRGDAWRAEEIKQETLIRAWKNPDAMAASRGFGSFRPWLFTVARRIAIDADRARRVRPQECDDAILAMIPEPDCAYDRLLLVELVRKAVAALSPEQRAVIHCLHFRSMTGVETARELGVPLGTVKSRSHYALKALQASLQEDFAGV